MYFFALEAIASGI